MLLDDLRKHLADAKERLKHAEAKTRDIALEQAALDADLELAEEAVKLAEAELERIEDEIASLCVQPLLPI